MPIPVTRYRCQFGCGRRTSTKMIIDRHEEWCSKNPELRACPTCKHEEVSVECDEKTDNSCLVRKCKVNSECFQSDGHYKMDFFENPAESFANIAPPDYPVWTDKHFDKLCETNYGNPAAITYKCDDWDRK